MADLLTAQEAAEKIFGGSHYMSTDKLYRLARLRRIPSIRIDGRVFFPLQEIRSWIKEQCQVEATAKVMEHYGRLREVKE